MSILGLVALWIGKATIRVMHWFGRGGSTLPGRLARAVDHSILRRLAHELPRGVVAVTGTNGKTTSATLLAGILRAGTWQVIHNRAGANLIGGVTSAFLDAVSWTGRSQDSAAVLEVDEATMPRAVPELAPRVTVVTNFFRDQLDRYGELETTVSMVRNGLDQMPAGAWMVVNADDPFCASLAAVAPASQALAAEEPGLRLDRTDPISPVVPAGGSDRRVLFFGIEDPSVAAGEAGGTGDAKQCLRCGHAYHYEAIYYAHLGKYVCPSCGWGRPRPHVFARRVFDMDARGSTVEVVTPAGEFTCRLPLPGLYNVYNALAAAAGALAMGATLPAVQAGLEQAVSSFGRMERISLGDREAYLALVKNPAGFNAVLRTVLGSVERKNLLLLLNDQYADGTDVSWIWDVDFELLAQGEERLNFVLCSGLRAEDMALRLKYAGISPSRIVVERDLEKALDQSLEFVRPGDLLYILPTYTAMLQMRSVLQKRGYTRQFWEV